MSLLRFRQISGSIITTASLTPGSLNSIRFEKVEGDVYTTYDLLIDTGSGGGGGTTQPSPPEYGIQYNSASAFKAESDFLYIYPSHSLQQGSATLTPGQYAHSEGKSTMAKGNFSHAEGQNTLASQSAAHAEGFYTTASGQYAHSEGRYTLASGIGAHVEGSGSIASGATSHAEGELCLASETGSHAEGYFTTASGKYAHSEGGMVTLKTGTKVYTVASGLYSHAEGMATTASGQAAHAEGEQNTASGVASHAEGYVVQATGQYSHAEGTYTITSGTYSHAEGGYTTAIGTGSHAEGYFTVAVGNYQHTQGTYNITSSADYAFIIGNGTAEPARSNLIFASASNFEVSGTLLVTGSGHKIQGLTSQSQNYVLTYNDITGQIYYTGSTNVGGAGTGGGADNINIVNTNQIQLSSGGSPIGSAITVPFASSSFTASFATSSATASFVTGAGVFGPYGSNSVTSASYALSSSYAVVSSTPISVTGSSIYSTNPATSNTNATNGVFLGSSAGGGALKADYGIFLGYQAGQSATSASETIIIGPLAGQNATKADHSVFIGTGAGRNAVSASYSTIIGAYAGWAPSPSTGVGTNNIIIGNYVTLPDDTKNSINIGAIIFATGSYSSFGTVYSGSMMGKVGINLLNPQYNFDVSGSGNYSNGLTVTGSLNAPNITGSLQGTASWATNALTASYVQTAQTASYVLQAVSSSYATTASYALNGGVTQIVAGTNITISPTNGLGAVTINSTGGGSSGAGANVTASFTNQSTWTFNHSLGNQGVIVQAYDTSWNQIIPQNITLTNANTVTITFPSNESGYAVASLGGVVSTAATASYVNTLNQNVIITGSVAIGTGSIGTGENNLLLGPAPAGGTGEGGQIALLAPGGSYTSSSFLDNYQNQFRVLSGPGAVSNTGVLSIDLQTRHATFQGAVTASGFNGLPNDYLYVTRNTNQTIGSGNWANQDIIFNNSVVSKGISYNTGTGLASLTGGKVYRITARLAWSAAAAYLLEFSCYNSSNTQLGPTTQIVQSTNGSNNISDGTLDFIYAPGSNVDIKIRTTNNTTALSGEYIRGDLNTQLIVQQIA